MRRILGATAILATTATLGGAPAAEAGLPFPVATGQRDLDPPRTATTRNGVSHLLWSAAGRTSSGVLRPELRYCRLQPAGRSCSLKRRIFPRARDSRVGVGSYWIFAMRIPSERLVIVADLLQISTDDELPRTDRGNGGLYAFRSSDGGRTWSRPRKIAHSWCCPALHRSAAPGPGESISFSDGNRYLNAPLSGNVGRTAPRTPSYAELPGRHVAGGRNAGDGGEMVAAVPVLPPDPAPASQGGFDHSVVVMRENGEYNHHTGGGSLNDPASWSSPSRFRFQFDDGYGLAGGPRGIVALGLHRDRLYSQCAVIEPPCIGEVRLPGYDSSGGVLEFDVVADPTSGRFGVVATARRGIFYSHSANGWDWSPVTRIVPPERLRRGIETGPSGVADPEISLGDRPHEGHVAWQAGNRVYAARLTRVGGP